MNPGTLKKSVPKKGRKCKGQETSQFCRICYRPFPISYGNFPTCKTGYISTENIFMVPQKKGLTKPLSSYFGDLSFHLDLGEQFSNHVCSPCSTKVRAAAAIVEVLKANLNQPSMCRCPEWKVQTNVKLTAPGATKQNSSKFKVSKQIWSKEIAIAWRNGKWKRWSRRTTLLRRYLLIVRLWGVPSRYGQGTVYPRRTYYSAPRKAAEDRVDCLILRSQLWI